MAFALFRPKRASDELVTVGIAQGQFAMQDILANFRKQKIRPHLVRTNKIYPLAKTGMVLCFVDPSTMVFGTKDAVDKALDARDGVIPSLLTNASMMDAMRSVDSEPAVEHPRRKGHPDHDEAGAGRSRFGSPTLIR